MTACYRFRQSQAQNILAAVLKEKLLGSTYHAENSSAWAREIADEVKNRLKGRYCVASASAAQVFVRNSTVEPVVMFSTRKVDTVQVCCASDYR